MTLPGNLLVCEQSLLVVIDMQTRLSATMPANDLSLMTANTIKLLKAAKLLDITVLITEQYPKGLGQTLSEISSHLPDNSAVFEKTGFSCWLAQGFAQKLLESGCRQIILMGQETHVCVLQTALDLAERGYQVYVVEDACCSRQERHKLSAFQRMQQQGVTLINYESVLFEWLRNAQHNEFKTISSLLR